MAKTSMDTLVQDWKTTLLGLLAGVMDYTARIGAGFPQTRDQWAAAGFAVALIVWGWMTPDPKP